VTASARPIPVIEPEPGGRAPAPEPLRVVQQFVNTNDREAGRDALGTPEALRDWFDYWTTWSDESLPTRDEHERALVVREGIRSMAAPGVIEAPVEFEEMIRGLDLHVVVSGGAFHLQGNDRLSRALAPLVGGVRSAMDGGMWERLKVCSRDQCQWLYYDSSRNASSRWCATEICGSREKARRAYRRKKTQPSPLTRNGRSR
jgi:predicted RNA-binding Zn ribbon-like protein